MTTLQIESSLDFKWANRKIKTYVALWGISAVLLLFVMLFVVAPDKDVVTTLLISAGIAAACGVLLAIPLAYYGVKKSKLLKNPEGYKLYSVMFADPVTRRNSCTFSVTLPARSGMTTLSTNPIFGSGAMAVFLAADYANKQVEVAYNLDTGTVLVMGLSTQLNVEDTSEIE